MLSSIFSDLKKSAALIPAAHKRESVRAKRRFLKILASDSKFFHLLLFFNIRNIFSAALVSVHQIIF